MLSYQLFKKEALTLQPGRVTRQGFHKKIKFFKEMLETEKLRGTGHGGGGRGDVAEYCTGKLSAVPQDSSLAMCML